MKKNKDDTENKIYIIKYRGGDYEDYYEKIIFATTYKTKAIAYVRRFNRILKKWKNYYKQFETKHCGITWIKEEYIDKYFQRWYSLQEIDRCFFESIELR